MRRGTRERREARKGETRSGEGARGEGEREGRQEGEGTGRVRAGGEKAGTSVGNSRHEDAWEGLHKEREHDTTG